MRRLSRWASAPRAAFRPSSHAADDAASSTTRVYLSNLPFDGLRHAALRACLERAGTVAQLVVPKTPEGRSRGYGFAEYASAAGARRARASLDGVEFGGRAMHVRPYRGRSGAERAVARAGAFEPRRRRRRAAAAGGGARRSGARVRREPSVRRRLARGASAAGAAARFRLER